MSEVLAEEIVRAAAEMRSPRYLIATILPFYKKSHGLFEGGGQETVGPLKIQGSFEYVFNRLVGGGAEPEEPKDIRGIFEKIASVVPTCTNGKWYMCLMKKRLSEKK